ncbi:MAG: hypothetical protein IMZ66_02175 [Planctomycetes bacterium]|nr:hypothetical protein [Planctomycetota bacterium]
MMNEETRNPQSTKENRMPASSATAAPLPAEFLRTYLPQIFTEAFSDRQQAMIDAFAEVLAFGGWRAIAAEEGEGKTSLCQGLAVYAAVHAMRRFVVLISADTRRAEAARENIRHMVDAVAYRDGRYPPDLSLLRGPLLVLPPVGAVPPGACGPILACRSITGPLRGLHHQGHRPDLVIIDDPDTHETTRSQAEFERREQIIDSDLAGLGGPDRGVEMFFLGTVRGGASLAARYTDPRQKPAWRALDCG